MSKPLTDVFATPKQADSLTRADALEQEITDLCAQINAASYRLLQLIAELDDEAPWAAWGLISCAHWLNWRCGIGLNAAREKVRVAHALKSLPATSSAFASGQLSFSKVRALTRIADSANEAQTEALVVPDGVENALGTGHDIPDESWPAQQVAGWVPGQKQFREHQHMRTAGLGICSSIECQGSVARQIAHSWVALCYRDSHQTIIETLRARSSMGDPSR